MAKRRRKPEFPSISRWSKDNRDLLQRARLNDDRSPIGHEWRDSDKYRAWKHNVLYRDKRCTNCGSDKKLQAHHIIPASVCPNLKYEPRNGRLLCKHCHALDFMHQHDPAFWRRIIDDL